MCKTIKMLRVISLGALLAFPLSNQALADECEELGELTVVGSADVSVKPDLVTINMAAVYEDPLSDVARNKAEKAIVEMFTSLKALKVSEKDIKAETISVTPNYDYIDGKKKFRSYTARRLLSVKTADFGLIAKILEASGANGINQISNITYSVKDENQAREEARSLAIVNAKTKAKAVAKGFEVKLKGISSINYDTTYGNTHELVMRTMALNANRDVAKNTVEPIYNPDNIVFNDTVTVVYKIKK